MYTGVNHGFHNDSTGRYDEAAPVLQEFDIPAAFFVPIFFVLMGLQVKLETFAEVSVLGVAYSHAEEPEVRDAIGRVQEELFVNRGFARWQGTAGQVRDVLAIGQIQAYMLKYRAPNGIDRIAWCDRVETHLAKDHKR